MCEYASMMFYAVCGVPRFLGRAEAEKIRSDLRKDWRINGRRHPYPSVRRISRAAAFRLARELGCPIEGSDRIYFSAEEVAEEAAEQAGKEVAQEAVERAIKSEIRPARELVRESVPGTEVHHLIEQRFAKRFGVEPSDLPAIRLDKTFHRQEVTARLFRKDYLPTGRSYTTQEIWNAYRKVYGEELHRQDWLEAIWPYFERLGVQR